jgi:DNA-binding CsgD family transcriptional regulator
VGLLVSERVAPGVRVPLDLPRVVSEGRLARVEVGPLTVAALYQVLKDRTGRSLPRRLVVRIEEATGGNPFFALEITRSLPVDAPVGGDDLPIPSQLLQLVDARILALPKRSRQAVLAASALRAPTVEMVKAAVVGTPEQAQQALDAAEARGILERNRGSLRFPHPILATAAYATASAVERRRMHQRLADLSDGVEERARHLALAAEESDGQLAEIVEAAAEHARARGAPESAAELIERALALTPRSSPADINRRTILAAEYHFHAGEVRQSRQMLQTVLSQPVSGLERASALRLLGEIHYHEQSIEEAASAFREALPHAEGHPIVQAAIELGLAYVANGAGDFAGFAEHGRKAVVAASSGADRARLAEALAATAMGQYMMGQGFDHEKIERALRLEDPYHQVPIPVRPTLIAGCLAFFEGQLARCIQLLTPLRDRIIDTGQDSDLTFVGCYLSWAACWLGDLERAELYATEAIETAERLESDSSLCQALAFAAIASAYRGDEPVTKDRSGKALELIGRTGFVVLALWASSAVATLALSADDPGTAHTTLAPLEALFEDGIGEPIYAFPLPDDIEALIALGHLERAEHLLDRFEEAARRLDRGWALMRALRCRALLCAARGDLEAATNHITKAVKLGVSSELRVEVARTLLAAGQMARRRRKKAAALAYLDQAVALFDATGAAGWAALARVETGRVGLRRATPGLLTESERRVAAMIASGRTNREVAAQLFMSPKTVEAKLAAIYRKLGVHSRAELGAHLARQGAATP